MPSKTAFQQLFFSCWDHYEKGESFTDVLTETLALSEVIYPELFTLVKADRIHMEWKTQQLVRQPHGVRMAHDYRLLCTLTQWLFTQPNGFVFTVDSYWCLECTGELSSNGKVVIITYRYYNPVTEGVYRIGDCWIDNKAVLVKETLKHLKYLRTGKNPYEALSDQ